jgi:peptidoglycan/xylan/chitin deacetylase (PgdA/CDA1 family)
MIFALRLFIFMTFMGFATPVLAAIPEDGHSAVILVYHRIGEDAQTSSIKTEQFLSHVEEIEKGAYNVMALPALIEALKKNDPLPPRTIAITFEGAFKSALVSGIPLLLEKKIPFTVFYSSDYADSPSELYMDRAELKKLSENKDVTLGLLPSSYARLKDSAEDEIRRQINKARQRHREMTGTEAQFFSYPFGEYRPSYKKIVEESGFIAAFGQQSGALSPSSDFFALPRFTMTEEYGDTARFRTAAETLPFPVHDVEPQGTYLSTLKPSIGFSVPEYLVSGLKSLSCFVTGQPDPRIQILHERVELRLKAPIDQDRVHVNCTIPGPPDPDDDSPLWRWFGMLLVNDDDSGSGVEEPSQSPTGLP